jgi:hypothetical protein
LVKVFRLKKNTAIFCLASRRPHKRTRARDWWCSDRWCSLLLAFTTTTQPPYNHHTTSMQFAKDGPPYIAVGVGHGPGIGLGAVLEDRSLGMDVLELC